MRKINEAGLNLIKEFESCELTPYVCPAGVLTIGWGHAIKEGEKFKKLTQQEADELLKKDVEIFERGVTELVKVALTDNQFSALVSFAFNCGIGNLKKSTLLKRLNQTRYLAAAAEFPKWCKADGKPLRGLKRRREAEKKLFETP
jgi:lysozyme